MNGRILFPGNPWPNGHGLKSLEFSVRLHRAAADTPAHATLDLSLASLDYCAPMSWEDACDASDRQMEEHPDVSDWQAMIVWNNYHACTIEPVWTHPDLVLATPDAPFDRAMFEHFERRIDPSETIDPQAHDYFDARAFTCYILGHDAVAGHDIAISKQPEGELYKINWSGRVAMAYGGDNVFRHSFAATAENVAFRGFIGRIPQEERAGLSLSERERRLRDLARLLVRDTARLAFHPSAEGAADRLVPDGR